MLMLFIAGAVVLVGCSAIYVLWDVRRKTTSPLHSWSSVINQYFLVQTARGLGYYMYRKLENDTISCTKAQEETLLSQIRENCSTVYGKDHKFSEINSREDFVRLHPLSTYSDYSNYIERVINGEGNIITAKPPEMLAVTSGTSGPSKIMPTTSKLFLSSFTQGISVLYYLMYQHFPNMQQLQKDMKFFYNHRWRTSPGGLLIGPVTSTPKYSKNLSCLYSTPPCGQEILSEPEARYIHLLFGLSDRELGMIEANFCSLIYAGFQDLHHKWPQLVKDIETGMIDPRVNLDSLVRYELEKQLKPNPKRAAELRQEFEKGFQGIVKRIWPKCGFVFCVTTGTNEIYRSHLKDHDLADVPLYSPLYAATEGLVGINIDPASDSVTYLLVPRAMFFEFIRVESAHLPQPLTLFMDQVEVGASYELVITNLSGFYRYRFGDVVKVTGFHNKCPIVEFQYRQGQYLNVRGEKTSEETFYHALMKASGGWDNYKVKDYCCVESVSVPIQDSSPSPLHYVVFVETDHIDTVITDMHQTQVDRALQEESFVYSSFRKKDSIGSIVIHQVAPGTFTRLKEMLIKSNNVSANQFKVPRVVKNPDIIKLLMASKLK